MAQYVLEILDGDRAGEVVTLGERPLRIGRKPQNDLVLVDEKASGVHAEVAFEGDRHVLRDLGSTNGTLMDGRKITEVVLGSGDIFAIGRVRVRFRGEGEVVAPAAAAGDGFAVDRIDAARLQAARSSSRSVAALVGVLVVALGAGGYVYWRGHGSAGATEGAATSGPRPELRVANNRLAQDVAACESDGGWDLQVAGAGFRGSSRANTGSGAFEALRAPATDAAPASDFAVAATAVEQKVLAGRTVVATAHLLSSGGGRGGVRLSFWSSLDGNPFRFRTGSPLVAHAAFESTSATAAVPAGADRCRVEIVALLPQDDSSVVFDDVALLEDGQDSAVERKVGEAATVLGTGQSLVVRSMDPEQPATVLAMLPGDVEPAFRGLAAADQLAFSDLGASIAVEADERAATLRVQGCSAVDLAFPGENAASLLGRGEQGFAGVDAAAFMAQEVLLGDRLTRCMVSLPAPAAFTGRTQGSVYWLRVPATEFQLVVGFRAERQQARDLLRTAEEAATAARPGAALDAIRDLLRTVPHDPATLAQALARRGEWAEGLAARLRQLGADLDEATFFDTRGGFERVVAQIDELLHVYGDHNLEDPAALTAMRSRAAARLAQLDDQRATDQRQRLDKMAAVFDQASQPGLAQLVRDYVKNELGGK